ncbi:MAG: hypothetical protein WCV99_13395 [Sterolibacterium sp.]
MNLPALDAIDNTRLIDIAREAHAQHQKLYLDRDGNLVTALQPQPGWVRIAVKVKSPTRAAVEPIPCAA